jgi:hypothetical protein
LKLTRNGVSPHQILQMTFLPRFTKVLARHFPKWSEMMYTYKETSKVRNIHLQRNNFPARSRK